MFKKLIAAFVLLFWLPASVAATSSQSVVKVGEELPRNIMALYDGKVEGDPRYTSTHRFLEMPLNHLGFVVQYHDVNEPMPELHESIRGVVVWFTSETVLENPDDMFSWLHKALDKKKKLLVMGGLGVSEKFRQDDSRMKGLNKLMHRIGVHDRNSWVNVVHNIKISDYTPEMVNFEREFEGEIRPYIATNIVGSNAKSHLRLRAPQYAEPSADLIITSANGGYVAEDYAVFQLYDENDEMVLRQWFINPFQFLREVFQDEYLPKPDTTTLFGKRIFYSHLDGDGWNNLSQVCLLYTSPSPRDRG